MVSSRGTVSGLLQRTAVRRIYRAGDARGVLFMNGWLSSLDFFFNPASADPSLLRGVTSYGWPLGCITTASTWGNSAIRADMSSLKTNLQAGLAVPTGKVHLFGQSMGGVCALNWAKNNPTLVQSICLVIPTVDIQAIYDNNRNSAASAISTAYGGRPADAENPAKNAASFTSFPMAIYYSTSDTYTTSSETTTFGAAAGATMHSMGAIGHDVGTPFSGTAVGAFFTANA